MNCTVIEYCHQSDKGLFKLQNLPKIGTFKRKNEDKNTMHFKAMKLDRSKDFSNHPFYFSWIFAIYPFLKVKS